MAVANDLEKTRWVLVYFCSFCPLIKHTFVCECYALLKFYWICKQIIFEDYDIEITERRLENVLRTNACAFILTVKYNNNNVANIGWRGLHKCNETPLC